MKEHNMQLKYTKLNDRPTVSKQTNAAGNENNILTLACDLSK